MKDDTDTITLVITPDTFKFRHWYGCEHSGTIFSAIRCKDGYRVEWVDGDTGASCRTMYSNEEVECYLSEGDWIVVEEDVTKEKPSVKKLISINVNSVRAAAEFDVANNKHTIKKNLSVEAIEKEIVEYIREMYSTLISGGGVEDVLCLHTELFCAVPSRGSELWHHFR